VNRLVAAAAAAWILPAVTLFARAADAQEDRQDTPLYAHHHAYESPQNFAVEIRFSPFRPAVDSDPSLHGCTPFADIFGTGNNLLFGMEFDWQALRIPHIGTIGPGVAAGYTSFSANAPYSSTNRSPNGCLLSNGQTSGETTSLTIYPMYLVAVFRADALWKDLGIPFVPYAKVGGGFAFWQASNTLGTSNYNGEAGQGYTIGSQLALGVSFNMNVLDPYAARNFDESMGVNSTYLFAEWTDANLDGLWLQSHPLRVGGTSWTFGIAWEF
jgi:hypothetical protein